MNSFVPILAHFHFTATSDKVWSLSEREDILEAFSAHPKIGDSKGAAQHGGVTNKPCFGFVLCANNTFPEMGFK